jgi:hypothetical protein
MCQIQKKFSCMSPDNLFSSAWISGWCQLSITHVCTWLFNLTQVCPCYFFTPLSFLCCLTKMLVGSNGIDVWQQNITCSIFRLQNSRTHLASCFPISRVPRILQALSKAFHGAICGITLMISSASFRWPAQPRTLTIQVPCSNFAETM